MSPGALARKGVAAASFLLALAAPAWGAPPGREQRLQDFDALSAAVERSYAYPESLAAWRAGVDRWRMRAAQANDEDQFVAALEGALELLRDDQATLSRRSTRSPRRIPQESDLWARFVDGTARIEAVRVASDADMAGVQPGASVLRIEGIDVARAVDARLGDDRADPAARDWALRHLLAGPRRGSYSLELAPGTRTAVVTHAKADPPVSAALARRIGESRDVGYLRLRFGSAPSVMRQLDAGLAALEGVRALVLDLRDSAAPRNDGEIQAVLTRLGHEAGVWRVRIARSGARTADRVVPSVHAVRAPLVVLVDRWTQGPAESLALGLRAVSGASLIGTPMAMLRGVAGSVRLPHSGIVARFATQRAHAPDGTPREDARPDVLVDLAAPSGGPGDPILYQALKRLERR